MQKELHPNTLNHKLLFAIHVKAWASALCNISTHESPLSDTQAIGLDALLIDLCRQATSEHVN